MRVLVVNPGSTGLKAALVEDGETIRTAEVGSGTALDEVARVATAWLPLDAAAVRFVHGGPDHLAPLVPAHVQGFTHQQETYLFLDRQRGKTPDILPNGGALQGGKPLSGDAEGVADGESDPPLAQIERHHSIQADPYLIWIAVFHSHHSL